MPRPETPEDVHRWFLAEVTKPWQVAGGSLSIRKSPCIREHCAACEAGQGHPSSVLYTWSAGRRGSLYPWTRRPRR